MSKQRETPETQHDLRDGADSQTPGERRNRARRAAPKTTPAAAGGAASKPYPTSWQVVQATAQLQSVAVSNFACYGSIGVPRYGVKPSPVPPPDVAADAGLCMELYVRDAAGELTLAVLDLTLRDTEHTTRQVIWQTFDAARRLQVIWVWDFYRIQSHVVLRVAEPPGDASGGASTGEPAGDWQATLSALRDITPGATITCDVSSRCGDIHQQHRVTKGAARWQP